jgi:hypothetical protein
VSQRNTNKSFKWEIVGSVVACGKRLKYTAPFGCADKPAEKHCWLICCERKTLFWLKKQAEKDGL